MKREKNLLRADGWRFAFDTVSVVIVCFDGDELKLIESYCSSHVHQSFSIQTNESSWNCYRLRFCSQLHFIRKQWMIERLNDWTRTNGNINQVENCRVFFFLHRSICTLYIILMFSHQMIMTPIWVQCFSSHGLCQILFPSPCSLAVFPWTNHAIIMMMMMMMNNWAPKIWSVWRWFNLI